MKEWHFVTVRERNSVEVRLYESGHDKPTHQRLTFTKELTESEMHDLHVKLAEALWSRTRNLK